MTFASKPASKERAILARRQTHVPILVIATEAANQLAWKNGLQLIDLFQGIVEESKPVLQNMTPFRSVGRSLFLKDINVRFVTPSHYDSMGADEAAALLDDHAALRDEDGDIDQDLTLLEDRIDELLQTQNDKNDDENYPKESLEEVTKEAFRLTSPLDSMPWLIRYRRGLDRSTDGLSHDLINCPPLVLLVCTATQEITAPENVLQEFYQSNHNLPQVYRKGIYDPSAMRQEVLVLHDNNDHNPAQLDEAKLKQLLRSRFGSNAALLRINSTSRETAATLAEQETFDPWDGKGKRGAFLSDNDKVLLRRYFQSLLNTALLPSLERRIADLNAIVSERKKGMRNLVKSFWRKPKEEQNQSSGSSNVYGQSTPGGGVGGNDDVPYRYDSIESQTLLLADTLFLMEDYENALSTYRLIRDDYKSDKALMHYGKVLEMIALCIFQLEPNTRPREILNTIEQALVSYTRAAEEERMKKDQLSRQSGELNIRHSTSKSPITRLATRLSLVMAMSSNTIAKNRSLECADLLASVGSYESSLGAAVLMEQSSVFFYKARMSRKYAFHMLMSGHMFQKSGQHHHAFRCFASAMYVYHNEKWGILYNHLKTALVSQLFTMGRMSVALVLYAKLVGVHGGGKVSITSQQKFVQNLVEICENHTKAALAGADRMLVPVSVPRMRRESYRNEKLEQIVHVVRYTRGASRVLELSNVNLPNIDAKSVQIWTKAEPNYFDGEDSQSTNEKEMSGIAIFGKPGRGDDKTWDDLELMTTAEVNAAEKGDAVNDNSQEETITAALAKIEDPQHRRFIAEIDREKQNRSLMERSKRKSKKPLPVVRARGEPIFCDFEMKNPLGNEIDFTDIQLVAKMVEKSDGNKKICTNEFAIQLNDSALADFQMNDWTFASTDDLQFKIPQFCRISEENVKSCTSAQVNPFFVVSKQSVKLAAEGETMVSLGITPLVEGDLEILGVRFKLQDKVWLYHSFDIPGPLLKDTRTNIMNKVRGESVYLKAKIESEMPCLTAELVKRFPTDSPAIETDDGPMLAGQISTWTIRLRNVGTAPATGVVLKTSLPWIDIVESETDSCSTSEEKKSRAISSCLGPSATLMALPGGDKIDPNQSLDIQIRVRTFGEQKQEFYMLYKYDLLDEKASKRRTRWLRNMYEVSVYPSLSFRANPLPTSLKGKEVLVSVELTNNRLDRPTDLYITLDRLSLTSRKYRLEALPGQFTRSKEFGDVLQIGWQEQVTVFYKVVLPEVEGENNRCEVSECPFSESSETTTKDCTSSSNINHLCLEDAFESFQSTWISHQNELMRLENTPDSEKEHPRSIASIRRANTSKGDGTTAVERENHPTSIGSLCPIASSASQIHLTCSWRAILGQEVVHGEHYLRRIPVAPKSFFEGCPVAAKAELPSQTQHDFSETPVAILPFTLKLNNRMLETPVKFTWSWESAPSSALELMGTCAQTLELNPSQETEISLQAMVTEAGIHDLQKLSFVVHKNGQEDETHHLSEQWLLHMVDSSLPVE